MTSSSAPGNPTDPTPPAAVPNTSPDRNLAMELVRVTESAALASGKWVGRGRKNEGDGAAVDAMRRMINTVQMNGVVVLPKRSREH